MSPSTDARAAPDREGSPVPVPRPAPGTAKWWVVGLVGCTLGTGMAIWFGLSATVGRVTWTDRGYDVIDSSTVDIAYDVQRPSGRAVTCVVTALDRSHGPVGTIEVRIPGTAAESVHRVDRVRTTTRAAAGLVKDCTVD